MVVKEREFLGGMGGCLMVPLLAMLGVGGLICGMHFSGGALIAGIVIMLLWTVPLGLMLLTDGPVQRPRRSSQARARMANRLRDYQVPGNTGDGARHK